MPVRPEVMASRIRQNATCLGAFKEMNLSATCGSATGGTRKTRSGVRICWGVRRDSVFDFDFYIYPEHRMGLAFVALWNGANAFLSSRGIRYTFSRLTRFNTASRRAHRHFGWKHVGRALFLQLGRFEMMLATVAPFAGISFAATSRLRRTLWPDNEGIAWHARPRGSAVLRRRREPTGHVRLRTSR